ncbi:MarR family protein [Pelagerythrobacter marensis]|uniref:MarR family protein n=1 Tax=Pelagerythrobacter marensis TaxID=543877 RepID=A0A0G3X9C9_9SPHN|nr:MarR family protein [Pelagerythrobacter marensis]
MSTDVSEPSERAPYPIRGRLYLARLSEELSDLITDQCVPVFAEGGLVIPVKSCSLMLAVQAHQPASARKLADALERSHQLVSQKLPKLVDLGLLEWEIDPADSRQKLYRLTETGKDQMRVWQQLQHRIDAAYAQLENEIGDITGMLRSALSSLRTQPIAERVATANTGPNEG